MNSLLIVDKNAEIYLSEIEKHSLKNLEIFSSKNPEEGLKYIKQVNILLGSPDFIAYLLPEAVNLQWAQSTFAGVDALCSPKLRKDYQLTGVKGVFGPLMAEFVLSYILAIERRLFQLNKNQSCKIWQELPYRSLADLSIGIAGLGSIGKYVASITARFGMRVTGLKYSPGIIDEVEKTYTHREINQFLPDLDYLVLILPNTPESKGIMGKEQFEIMKNSATIINVGRGASINQKDLIHALNSKQIKGAVLDVFEEEPLPQGSPLWEMPNVHISPHIAAVSFPNQIADIFCKNYQRFQQEKPLNYLIDFKRGY